MKDAQTVLLTPLESPFALVNPELFKKYQLYWLHRREVRQLLERHLARSVNIWYRVLWRGLSGSIWMGSSWDNSNNSIGKAR